MPSIKRLRATGALSRKARWHRLIVDLVCQSRQTSWCEMISEKKKKPQLQNVMTTILGGINRLKEDKTYRLINSEELWKINLSDSLSKTINCAKINNLNGQRIPVADNSMRKKFFSGVISGYRLTNSRYGWIRVFITGLIVKIVAFLYCSGSGLIKLIDVNVLTKLIHLYGNVGQYIHKLHAGHISYNTIWQCCNLFISWPTY